MDDRTQRLNADALLTELGWLRRLARGLVGPAGIEDDLVQETWLAANRVQGEVSRAWLVGTISKLAARWYRGEARLAQRQNAVAKPEAVDIESQLERNDLLAVILGQLRSLDEPFRMTLVLLYQEGMSVQDAAVRLDAPEDTIRWRRREALVRLRSRLDAASGKSAGWRGVLLPLAAFPRTDTPAALPTFVAPFGSLTTYGASAVILKTVIVVSLSVAAWWFVSLSADSPADPLSGATVAQSSGEGTWVERSTESDGLTPVAVPEGRGVVPTEPEGTNVPPTPVGPTVNVHVVGSKGQPVIGATAWVGETPDPSTDSPLSDAEGVAHMPAALMGKVNRISATLNGLYGRSDFIPQVHGNDCTVMLFPDADAEVLVLGADGRPHGGVPVGLVHTFTLKDRPEVRNLRFEGVVYTDTNGVGVIRHVRSPAMYRGGSAQIEVGPAVLLGERPDVTLDALGLPRDPIRIVLPAVGSLAIQVLESGGGLSHASGTIRLAVDTTPDAHRDLGDLKEQLRLSPRRRVTVDFEEGVGVLPMIGLGLPLIAGVLGKEPVDSMIGIGAGPLSTDVPGTLTLRTLGTAPELVGVLLNGSGEPLIRMPVKLSVRVKGKVETTRTTALALTDEQGGFRLHVNDELLAAWGRTHVHQLQVFVSTEDPLASLTASMALPGGLEPGENDVGALHCVSVEPLFRGRASDSEGNPVQLAASDLEVIIGVREDPKSYRFLDHARFATDQERFALFAPDPVLRGELGESFYVTASVAGHPWVRQEVLPGVSNVELKFEAGARIAGAVVMETGQSPVHHSGKFYCEDQSGVERPYGRSTFRLDGTFTVVDVPPRRGRFVIRGHGSPGPLATFQDILPGAGVESQDPRLAAIDLRAATHAYSLRIAGQGLSPLKGASLRVLGDVAPQPSFAPGLFSLRRAESPLHVELSAPGHSPLTRTLAPGDHVITMEPSPPATADALTPAKLPD